MLKRLPIGVTALLAAASFVGCGGQEQGHDADAARARAAWDSARSAEVDVVAMQRRLERRCMEKKGYRIHPPSQPGVGDKGSRSFLRDALPPTPDDASANGYGIVSQIPGMAPGTTTNPEWDRAPESYKKNYGLTMVGPEGTYIMVNTGDSQVGMPGQGCMGEVIKQLYGDKVTDYIRGLQIVGNDVRNEAVALMDAKARERLDQDWAECMKQEGEDNLASPESSRGRAQKWADSADRAQLQQALLREKTLAMKDARCGQRVDYASRLERLEDAPAKKVLATKVSELVAWEKLTAEANAKARSLMGSSAP